MRLGDVGQIMFHSTGLTSLEYAGSYYRITDTETINFGYQNFQFVADPESEVFQLLHTTSNLGTLIRSEASGLVISAGESMIHFNEDGELMLLANKVNLGQPGLLSAYEPALLGEATLGILNELVLELLTLLGTLATPLVGAAQWPVVNAQAVTSLAKLTPLVPKTIPITAASAGIISGQVSIAP